MQQPTIMQREKKPVFCRECKGKKTFERFPEGDTKTMSGKVILECWKCRECGHIARMTARWD